MLKALALLGLILCFGSFGRADAPTYGSLRVIYDEINVYEGASAKSKIAGAASSGDEFVLRGDKLYDGFYKIQYGKKICFVMGNQVKLLQPLPTPEPTDEPTDEPTPAPTRKPTVKPTIKPTEKPSVKVERKDDSEGEVKEGGVEGDDEEREPTPTRVPTKAATIRPTMKPTLVPTEEPTDEATEEPTAIPTKKPTLKPTLVPTLEPTDEATEEPTAIPTRKPTLKPTLVPTEEPSEEPTAIPTKKPTPKPTLVPTLEPTDEPTAVPTRQPTPVPTVEATLRPTMRATVVPTFAATDRPTMAATAMPTPVPTARPTLKPTPYPTQIPTEVPTAAPTPEPVSVGHGRRRKTPTPLVQRRIERHSNTAGLVIVQGAQGMANLLPPRDPDQRAMFWLYMPIGAGKNMGSVEPAFKPDPGVADIRNIESSAFVGLGLEVRTGAPWLRFSGDWTYFTHRTKAADMNKVARKVSMPAPSSAVFPDSDVYYQMNTQAFRLGMKMSLPFRRVEPWINGTVGLYGWSAEYLSATREWTYGGDMGLAFGGTAGLGIDFHFPMAHSVFTLTPFVEWGAPVVNPKVTNIADIGQDWTDPYGTPVAPQSRAGLQLAIGY